MVKSIGIDPGDLAVKVVELDGNYKRTRLQRVHVGPVAVTSADDPLRPDAVAEVVRAALDEGMRGALTLGHPCREAVLRTLEVPFKGHDAIKKVVKSEIEGEIYTHSVDEMVVDFHEIGVGGSGATRLLVASVPKGGLRNQLTALAAQNVDPEHVDLDTMALWRAAHWAGAFTPPVDDAAAETNADGARVSAVVDLGARSVKVILVEGEQLIEMRALRLGDAALAEQLVRQHGLPLDRARELVSACLATGEDQQCEIELSAVPAAPGDAADAAAGDGVDPASGALAPVQREVVVVQRAAVEAAQTAYLRRVARELTRFLTASGLASRIGSVWVTGGGCRAAGVHEMLAAVFGVEPRELDLFARLQHDLPEDEVHALNPRLATAIGLALRPLGGPEGFQLRQEDLALMRGFERVKFPLALACMAALLALFVHGNRRTVELRNLEYELGRQFHNPDDPNAVIFFGHLFPLFDHKWFENPNHFRIEREGSKDYTYRDLVAEVAEALVHERVRIVRDRLKKVAEQKQKDSGIYQDVKLESGLAVLVRWAEMMKSIEPQLGRYLLPRLSLNMKSQARKLEFTVGFRGEDFRSRMAVLESAIRAECQRPDTPFEAEQKIDELVDEKPFTDAAEKGVAGAWYRVSIRIRDSFEAFGPSAQVAASESPGGSNAGAGGAALASTTGERR